MRSNMRMQNLINRMSARQTKTSSSQRAKATVWAMLGTAMGREKTCKTPGQAQVQHEPTLATLAKALPRHWSQTACERLHSLVRLSHFWNLRCFCSADHLSGLCENSHRPTHQKKSPQALPRCAQDSDAGECVMGKPKNGSHPSVSYPRLMLSHWLEVGFPKEQHTKRTDEIQLACRLCLSMSTCIC